MVAEKIQTVSIPYPKRWFLIGTVLYAIVTSLFFYLSSISVGDFAVYFWLLVGIVEGVLVFLFIVPPLFTSHAAGAKALRLRMGLLASADISYDWIKSVKQQSIPWGGVRVGIGARYSPIPKILFITSSFSDLIRIELYSEHLIGRLWKRPVTDIVLSVSNMTGMMDIIRDRVKPVNEEE